MNPTSHPLPAWQKWLMRLLGTVLIAFSCWALFVITTSLWVLAHSREGLFARSGAPLTEGLGRLVGTFLPLSLGIWLWRRSLKKPATASAPEAGKTGTGAPEPLVPTTPKASTGRAKRYQLCNVLSVGAGSRRVWQFDARRNGFVIKGEQQAPNGEPMPPNLIGKSWATLFQPKLNVAWLPPEHVFLRVAHLPQSSFDETLAMVELQLEKLSPLPVTQIVWSIHVMPQTVEGLQTVIVMIAARNSVEEFLGKLEGDGYLADRLELSSLDQLQNTPITRDGVWVYPEAAGGISTALVAWWCGGALHHLGLIHLPPGQSRAAAVKDQLAHMAWAGELEGWLAGSPRLHLVASETTMDEWELALREGLGEPVETVKALPLPELAAATANRAALAPARSNLLPPEFTKRYEQQFVDRLWMRGLGVVLGLYVVGVVIYLGAVQVLKYRTGAVKKDIASNSGAYTNALKLKARYQVLKDREELKFAALDCWKVTAELLPQSLTLQGLDFRDGKKLTLNGSAPADQVTQVFDFNDAMRKAKLNDQPLFSKVEPPNPHKDPNSPTLSWNFSCDLNRAESP